MMPDKFLFKLKFLSVIDKPIDTSMCKSFLYLWSSNNVSSLCNISLNVGLTLSIPLMTYKG